MGGGGRRKESRGCDFPVKRRKMVGKRFGGLAGGRGEGRGGKGERPAWRRGRRRSCR